MQPATEYTYLLHEAPEWLEKKPEDCPSRAKACMFGAVTPAAPFLKELFDPFPEIAKLKSCDLDSDPKCEPKRLRSGRICTYGPWVMEDFHEWWPEIHPAEIIWGREGNSVLVQQLSDRSGRFQKGDDYLKVRESDLRARGYLQSEMRTWRPWGEPTTARRVSVAWATANSDPVNVSLISGQGLARDLRRVLASGMELVVSTDLPSDAIVWPGPSDVCVQGDRTLG